MHLGHAAVFAKTPVANQGNHLQAKFPVRQCPASFFFRTIGHMIARTLRLHAATHHNRHFPETIQLGHCAMAVVAHPQRLTALFARLFQRGQCDRVRRFGTRGSGSSDHGHSPAELFILLLSFLQATPAVKLSFPFRGKKSLKPGDRVVLTGILRVDTVTFPTGETHPINRLALTQAPQMLVKEKRVSTTVYEQQRKPR
jgi:hypothetical protein